MNWHSLRGSPTFHSLFIPNLWWDEGIVVWWFSKQYSVFIGFKTKLVLGCSFRHTCWKTSVTLKRFELKSTFLELSILHHFSTLQGNSLRMDFLKLLHEPNPQDTAWCSLNQRTNPEELHLRRPWITNPPYAQLAEGCQQRSETQHVSPWEILWKRGCTPLAMHPLEWHEDVLQLARSRSSSWTNKNILPAEKCWKHKKLLLQATPIPII